MTFDPTMPPPAPVEIPSIASAPVPTEKTWTAIVSLVIGILNICGSLVPCCGGIFGVVGIITGILGLKTSKRTMALIGLILSGLTLILSIIVTIMVAINLPEILERLESMPY
jgi:hypothetical protein